MKFDWYSLYVKPRFEEFVAEKLISDKENVNNSLFQECLIPSVTVKNKQNKEYKTNLYPGYLFVLLNYSEIQKIFSITKKIPQIYQFVLNENKLPKILSNKEYEDIIKSMKKATSASTGVDFYSIGDVVKITEGSFKEFEGIVYSVDNEKALISVKIEIFGRDMEIDLPFSNVVKVKK